MASKCWFEHFLVLAHICRDGIQQRKNCWQDGMLGTNCPILTGWNWTYNFQVKGDAWKSLDYPEALLICVTTLSL